MCVSELSSIFCRILFRVSIISSVCLLYMKKGELPIIVGFCVGRRTSIVIYMW